MQRALSARPNASRPIARRSVVARAATKAPVSLKRREMGKRRESLLPPLARGRRGSPLAVTPLAVKRGL